MAKERSPRFPGVSLVVAVDSARKLYKKEGRSAVPPEVAVTVWGYSGLSGPARVRIGALRQYGLLDATRDGSVKLSPRGVTVATMPSESPDWQRAIREAALAPPTFAEIYRDQPEASDDTLRYYLMRKRGFLPDAAKRLVEFYRATLDFADINGHGYDEGPDEVDTEEPDMVDVQAPVRSVIEVPGMVPETATRERKITFFLGDEVFADVIVRGSAITVPILGKVRRLLLATEQLAEVEATEADMGHTASLAEGGQRFVGPAGQTALLQSPHEQGGEAWEQADQFGAVDARRSIAIGSPGEAGPETGEG